MALKISLTNRKPWLNTCEEVIWRKKTRHKTWISADTIWNLDKRSEKKMIVKSIVKIPA